MAILSDDSTYMWGGGPSSPVTGHTLSSNGKTTTAVVIEFVSYAVMNSDGTIRGYSPDTTYSCVPPPGLTGDVIGIAQTAYSNAALMSDGSVYAWGEGDGTGGYGDFGGIAPTSLTSGNLGDKHVTTIVSNYGSYTALLNDGSVVSWGWPMYGGETPTITGTVTSVVPMGYAMIGLTGNGTIITTTTTTTRTPTTTTTTTTTTHTPGGGGPTCFLGHAPVLTPRGNKRIDSLKVGDLVLTETGKSVPIQRISVQRYRPGPSTNPYIVRKGQFGATEELLVSPRHRIAAADGDMVEARELGLKQKEMKSNITYYNLELPGWANMVVAGVEVESLSPSKGFLLTQEQFQAALSGITMTEETLKALRRTCSQHSSGKVMVLGGPLKL